VAVRISDSSDLFRWLGRYVSTFPSAASALSFGEHGVLTLVALGVAMSFRVATMDIRLLRVMSAFLAISFGVIGFRCYVDLSRRRVVAANVEAPPNVASPC